MRCPDCHQRNSVAANKCKSCGHRFKKKPVTPNLKIAAAVAGGALILWLGASVLIPSISDPEQNLIRMAKRLSQDPTNVQLADQTRKDFDQAVRSYLTKLGSKSNDELVTRLKKIFPESTFEIHIVDLPRGLKVIEIDTAMQANGFLVMKSDSQAKVFPLSGLEVFDDARLINESQGPMLVLLGHAGGQPPHKPQIKVYALLPDSISDESDKLLPPIHGEGQAHFAKNGRDIVLDLSLLSLAQAESLFGPSNQTDDGTVHQYLEWNNAHYGSRTEYDSSPFTALYTVARCLRYPELTKSQTNILGADGLSIVQNFKSANAAEFQATRLASTPKHLTYRLSGNVGKFDIAVARVGGNWTIVSAKQASAAQESAALPQVQKQATQSAKPVITEQRVAQAPVVIPPASVPVPPTHVKARLSQHSQEAPARLSKGQPQSEPVSTGSTNIQPGQPAEISAAASANMRSEPSISGKQEDAIATGTPIEILGKRNGWYRVRYNGKVGYVYGDLVTARKSASPPPVASSESSSRHGHGRTRISASKTTPKEPVEAPVEAPPLMP